MKRANRHVDRLKQWEKSDTRIGNEERTKLFEMLGEALEMSLLAPLYCYSADLTSIWQALLSSPRQQGCLRHWPRGATLASPAS